MTREPRCFAQSGLSFRWRELGAHAAPMSSAAECDSLFAHAELIGAVDPGMLHELVEELTVIRKMLFRLRAALQTRAAESASATR